MSGGDNQSADRSHRLGFATSRVPNIKALTEFAHPTLTDLPDILKPEILESTTRAGLTWRGRIPRRFPFTTRPGSG